MSANSRRTFGDNMAWYAVRNANAQQISAALQLTSLTKTSWDDGIKAIYEDCDTNDDAHTWSRVFITPPVNNWILVAGWWAMSHLEHIGLQQMETLCKSLSVNFDEVQNIGVNSKVDYYQWVLAKKGVLVRSFEYLQSEVMPNLYGSPTDAEIALGWPADAQETWRPTLPEVLALAGRWSINPMELNSGVGGPCYIVNTPEHRD